MGIAKAMITELATTHCYIIAEISANHNGSLDAALEMVAIAKEAGADAVKIQTYTADTLTLDCDNEYFRIGGGTLWDGTTLHELYKKAYTPWEWHTDIFAEAKRLEIDCFSTPFDESAVDFLEQFDPPFYKIASFELNHHPLLEKVAATGRPVIMSTGMATLADIEGSVAVLRANGCTDLTLLKCTSSYPAPASEANLARIPDMIKRFKVRVGLSDHTLGTTVPVVAVALGATVIEKHFCRSRKEPGPDSAFSLEPREFAEMVRAVRIAEQAIGVAEAVVKVQRDFGYRGDRKRARLKYLIHDQGIDWFRGKVDEYYGTQLADCTHDDVREHNDHMGWDAQGDGKWFYGFNVENGRLYDDQDRGWKAALRDICQELNPEIRLTAHQSILFCDIEEKDKSKLEGLIKKRGLPLTEEISNVRRWSIACVAMPTCGLAITESERVLPSLIDDLEKVLAEMGLDKELFTLRMTGCPNGCARPYNADIGLVGKAKGKYTMYVGGTRIGTRLAFIFKDLVPFESIVSTLKPLFVAFKAQRNEAETFGDFCTRIGNEQLNKWYDEANVPA